ncbi:unnamed protein product [Penicillium pancosmium]
MPYDVIALRRPPSVSVLLPAVRGSAKQAGSYALGHYEDDYAIQLEVIKTATKGEYMIRFGYDERSFTDKEVRLA